MIMWWTECYIRHSGRSIISLCCQILLRNTTKLLMFHMLSFPPVLSVSFLSLNSWPSCGESQHWQDSILPGRAILCSEIWKVVFRIWGDNWRRHACRLGQARLSAWHCTGSRWPSLCVWRQPGESGHILSPSVFFSKHFPGSWKYLVCGSLASKWAATTSG